MEHEELLQDEIKKELEALGGMQPGSDSYKVTVDGLTKLLDREIELEKVRAEAEERVKTRENENKLKLEQMANDQKDQLWRNGIAIAGILIPTMVTIWGTFKTLKFEENGTVTTMMGRGFINKLLPKK